MTVSGLDSVRAAFHQVHQRKELVAVEILWKWAWAASVLAIFVGSTLLFLNSVTLSSTALRGLRSGQPWLIAVVLRRLWSQHAPEFVRAMILAIFASAVLWWIAASIFRSGIAGSLVEEPVAGGSAFAPFGPAVRQSLAAYLGSHLWSLGVAVVTLWLAAQVLWRLTTHRRYDDPERMPAFLGAVVVVAGLLFFWQFVAWMLGLGRAVASRHGWGFVRSLGFALHLFGARLVDVLFATTTMFLFRVMAVGLAAAAGLVILYVGVLLDRRLAAAGFVTALMLISVPARWLFVVQQAAYLELAREPATLGHEAWAGAK